MDVYHNELQLQAKARTGWAGKLYRIVEKVGRSWQRYDEEWLAMSREDRDAVENEEINQIWKELACL